MQSALVLILATLGGSLDSPAADGLKEKIDSLIAEKYRDEIAMSIVVVKNSDIVYSNHWGFEDEKKTSKVTNQSVFNLASVTKTITAVGVLQLIEKGALSFKDKLSDLIEGVPGSWKEVTILQMLEHTSGIMDYGRHPDARTLVFGEQSLEEVRDMILSWELEFEPGGDWGYSNSAYHLLGHVIASKSDMSFDKYLEKHIFRPAGMSRATLEKLGGSFQNRVAGFGAGDKLAPFVNPNWSFGAGAVSCTAEDLARFDIAVHAGKLLSKDMLKSAQTPRGEERMMGLRFGLGWIVNEADGKTFVGSIGGKPGFSSAYVRQPDSSVSVVVLRGSSDRVATETVEMVLRAVLDN